MTDKKFNSLKIGLNEVNNGYIYKIDNNFIVDSHGLRNKIKSDFYNYDNVKISPIDKEEYERAFEYSCYLEKRKTKNKNISSYGLKHSAERFLQSKNREHSYVSNGSMIAALLVKGFSLYKEKRDNGTYSINTHHNISVKSIIDKY